MPATVVTKEPYPDATDAQLEAEMALRIKAGAIRSWVEEIEGVKTLCTEWNIVGEQ